MSVKDKIIEKPKKERRVVRAFIKGKWETYTIPEVLETPRSRLDIVFEREDKKEINKMLHQIGKKKKEFYIHSDAIIAAVKLLYKKTVDD